MKARLILCTVLTALLPVSNVLLVPLFRQDPLALGVILVLGIILQIPVILSCQHALKPFIHPDPDILQTMGVAYVPIAYEPGRFKVDSKVCGILVWASALPGVLTWIATLHPETINPLGFFEYTIPSLGFLAAALISLLFGTVALPLWFEFSRGAVIYSEGNDRKRYLLRGFVDQMDERGASRKYRLRCKNLALLRQMQ